MSGIIQDSIVKEQKREQFIMKKSNNGEQNVFEILDDV